MQQGTRFRLLLSSCLIAMACFGQEFRGRIQGTVTDTSQAAVVGANVMIRNTGTGVVATRQTNETGHYLFDLVEPGTYEVAVEFAGFSRFVQESVLLQQRGDVTVNATLRAGDIKETVTVSADANVVQFNTSKLETTVDSKLTGTMPQLYRTPFLLAQLDPAVEKDDYQSEYMPYHSWGANHQKVGGGQNYTADLQVDGAPVGIGYKTAYVPSPDMVQEVNVQQNAVDAEYGHSAGSAISLTLKSGTNQYHGTAFYQGQYPWANALEDRVYRTVNMGRNHMYGGTLGHPIKKNKLFNFVAYEGWRQTDPSTLHRNAADRPGACGQLLAIAEQFRRPAHDLRSVEHADFGRRQNRYPHTVSRQHHPRLAVGPRRGELHRPLVETQLRRHRAVSRKQLQCGAAHPLSL